jgi:two-component system, OmpR family, sensor histidine kinase CreC
VRIRTRLLLALFATTAVAFFFLSSWLRDDVKFRYFQILEDGLAETTTVLAAFVESQVKLTPVADTRQLATTINAALSRKLAADIFGQKKHQVDLRIYLTDVKGKVIYDSAGFGLGHDYSRWNDVYLTLHGKYGARSSRDDPRFPNVSIKYVAAPVFDSGKIVGVITAAKPAITLSEIIDSTKAKILATLIAVFAVFILIGFIVTYLITRPLDRLIAHVKRLRTGAHEPMPNLGSSEIAKLAHEFQLLKNELDGRKYVESFVQMLTHEFKSPVAGILGAAEILEGATSDADKVKFLGNIQREAQRIGTITDNLLQIATLENAATLPSPESLNLSELMAQIQEDFASRFATQSIELKLSCGKMPHVTGNYFLLYQAISNLVQNALDFSQTGSTVELRANGNANGAEIEVFDTGSGIPAFATDRIFEKFYSLDRPQTRRKSTGLGLSLVQLIVSLHRGTLVIENRPSGGVVAKILLPLVRN